MGSVAFLVPRPDLTGFLSRIAPVASRAVGVAVVPTGPWPPYSFVPPLERAPSGAGARRRPASTPRTDGWADNQHEVSCPPRAGEIRLAATFGRAG